MWKKLKLLVQVCKPTDKGFGSCTKSTDLHESCKLYRTNSMFAVNHISISGVMVKYLLSNKHCYLIMITIHSLVSNLHTWTTLWYHTAHLPCLMYCSGLTICSSSRLAFSTNYSRVPMFHFHLFVCVYILL